MLLSMTPSFDFRSDTVTQPSPEMRRAMAEAEVGDDVLEHDPTLARLEARVAELTGMEGALWTPTGCMANLIALMLHLQRGDRFLAPEQAHVLGSELGTAAWLAGGMPHALPWDGGPGRPKPATVTAAAGRPGPYFNLRTTLLCLENTHNFAGGAVTPVAEQEALVAAAKAAGLKVHVDGARLWHAAAALGCEVKALTRGVDTVQVCLSKGLGAPMGSLLCGSRSAMEEARRIRKMLGGGVRQGGVVGAAGLVALDYLPRLSEDHAKARLLAEGLRGLGFSLALPETNILLVEVPEASLALEWLSKVGVMAVPVGNRVRFIPHRDLSEADVRAALARIAPVAESILKGAA
ncbi:MAG TPA: GntG family PLP-dependent aldolase [Holophagaceae bacterium]|nr:GntG family PLP-dependent aldolase [Holophagaceae bacterium]